MDHKRRAVGVVDDGVGDTPEEHRTQPREASRTDHNRRSVVEVGCFDDRLPRRARRLDGNRLGLEAGGLSGAGAIFGHAPLASAPARSSSAKLTTFALAPYHADC